MESPDTRNTAMLPRRVAPLKPWELRNSNNGNMPPSPPSSAISRQALTSSPSSSPSMSSSSSTPTTTALATTTAPRPPARPWERPRSDYSSFTRYDDNNYGIGRDYMNTRDRYSYGYNSMGSYGGGYGAGGSAGGGYGGLGGYGNYSGGYNNRDRDSYYGGYGGGYSGGYGGMNGGLNGGMNGRGDPFYDKPGGLLANGFSWMNSLQYVVDTFSRFSRLLDANYDAMHGSFTSVLRLCERMGQLNSEVMMMIKTFTIFRLLQSFSSRFMQVFRYMSGRPMADGKPNIPRGKGGFNLRDFEEFSRGGPEQPRAPGWGAMMMVFVVTFVGLPVVLHRLVTLLTRSKSPRDQMELQWGQTHNGQERVRALFSFVPETSRDLPFQAGDILVVLNKGHPDWWEAEGNGRAGLIPSNYVEPIENSDQYNQDALDNSKKPPGE